MDLKRRPGTGWLALLGGGELTFGETEEVDAAWLETVPAAGVIGFVPTASGSTEYGGHFATYLRERFDRQAETIPIYRGRDARRAKNRERVTEAAVVYLGGGVTDHLLDVLPGTPCGEALEAKLESGGTVVAIAAAAQAVGQVARSLLQRTIVPGLGWLEGGVIEPNFDPNHDRRLRQLLEEPGVSWGLGLPAGSAVLLGPEGEQRFVGLSFGLADADDDFVVFGDDP